MTVLPRILVAGTHSGAGKTSVTLALLSAFTKRGMKVQGFKVGPDYIDPGYHTVLTGRPSRNLDAWMLTPETVKGIFAGAMQGADLGVVEGVMGLFDGLGSASETASTSEMAKFLKAPVLLVIDAQGLSRSSAAMVLGYKNFDPALRVVGVILNKVSGEKHANLLTQSIERYTKVPVLGFLPRDQNFKISERHLGLVTAKEQTALKKIAQGMASAAEKYIQLDKILALACEALACGFRLSASTTSSQTRDAGTPARSQASFPLENAPRAFAGRIGMAHDAAFSFYYEDNLALLKNLGSELVPFSPLNDPQLPEVSGLYLGGGFPEVYAAELSANESMRRSVREKIRQGLPTYAECGGLMYLAESLRDSRGGEHPMAGVIPGKIVMTERLQNFGYSEATVLKKTLLGEPGETIRGHEFHYSRWEKGPPETQAAYSLRKPTTGDTRTEGFATRNLLASYLHIHFLARPSWAERFSKAVNRFACQTASVALLLTLCLVQSKAQPLPSPTERELAIKIIQSAQERLGHPFPSGAFQVRTVEESLSFLGPDSRVVLTRPSSLDFVRGLERRKSISSQWKSGLGYLRIEHFDRGTGRDAWNVLKSWTSQGLKGLILDLRGNTGGRFDEAVKLAGALARPGIPGIRFHPADGADRTYTTTGELEARYPIVLLVNDHTASSAEMVALLLKHHDRALAVGLPTKGKNSVQEIIPLDAHHLLLLTVGQYEIIGHPLSHQLRPDFYMSGYEEQTEKARRILKKEVAHQ